MRIETEIRYAATPDAVGSMLADPSFVDRKCAATGALRHTAEVDGDASGAFTVTTVRTMATDTFPDVARKFVGETVDLKEVDSWDAAAADGARSGTVVVEISGAPLKLTGTLSLRAHDDGTLQTIEGDLKASVPIIGGRLEKAAEPALQMAMRKEGEVGREWLAR